MMTDNVSEKHGLLQSPEEWTARNRALASTLSELIQSYVHVETLRALDVGCQVGTLTDLWESPPGFKWWGVDPVLQQPMLSRKKAAELLPGWAHQLPFPASHFDCVMLANVYEHIAPEQRTSSLAEIQRVLVKGGILVGQLPNPYFLIESHSRLPFMGWLPRRVQLIYWQLAPVPWKHGFYVVTMKDLKRRAETLGFETVIIRDFNYPIEATPKSIRGAAWLVGPVMRIMPWSWQFVFRKT